MLAKHLIGSNLLTRELRPPKEVFRSNWGNRYRLEMRAPSVLSPADPNVVELECQIGPGEEAEFLLGRIEDLDEGNGFDEMTELRRSECSDVFTGRFVVPWRRNVGPLPTLRLSLFADSRPLFRKVFSVSSPGAA